MAKKGRPSDYSPEIANIICEQIATSSKSLRTICNDENLPCVQTILTWLNTNTDFLAQYARAKEQQADFLAEEILDISDDGSNDFMTITKGDESYNVENKEWTSRSKLRVEARKWIAAKLKPKKYGDKVETVLSGTVNTGTTLTDEQIEKLMNHTNAQAESS
jgi:hypothetical protein